ncbi:hypothetical protein N0V84_010637 [Fusarium piperis]|uniref:Uncharacterized protein n=1 Tax=Fusarium piperis TaxID=1435070 RepID=A0A9W8TBX0_9HYPO|nr:hypothetical protein N0V84_010637 [Fusarium piperis]
MNTYEPTPRKLHRIALLHLTASSQLDRNNNNHNSNDSPSSGSQQQQGAPSSLLPLVRTKGTRLLWVDLSGQQLGPYIHNEQQQAVLRLPGRPVTFLRDRVQLAQVESKRDSYVNAFLIQSRGVQVDACSSCLRKMSRDPSSYAHPFPDCIRLPGRFGGCCGNCKWPDHGASCSKRDEVVNVYVPAPSAPTLPAPGSRNDMAILISDDESSTVSEPAPYGNEEAALPGGGDDAGGDQALKEEFDDNDDNAMDLVPAMDGGLASDGTAKDPLQLD